MSKYNTVRLYTTCCFCGAKMSAHDKRMSCVDCKKRPEPVETYTDDLMRVQVYPPGLSGGVEFSVMNDFAPDSLRGRSL